MVGRTVSFSRYFHRMFCHQLHHHTRTWTPPVTRAAQPRLSWLVYMHVLFVRQSTFFIFKPVNYFHVDKNETGLNGKALQVHFTVSFLEYLYLYGTVHKI